MKEIVDGNSKGDSFMDRLFETSAKLPSFTYEDIKGETMTVAGAATDTSALTAASLVLMLGMHSDVQERVFKEVLSIMPEKTSPLIFDNLNELTYMDQCLNETMRLFPPVTVIPRESEKPFVLKNGIVVPPRIPLAIGVRQIHRNEKYWGPNANLFDPTRFEKERMKDLPPTCFIPFSYGPRNCAGIYLRNIYLYLNSKPNVFFLSFQRYNLCKSCNEMCCGKFSSAFSHRNTF